MCMRIRPAGWNDPPLFSYQSMGQPSNKKGSALTKRPLYPADKVPTSAPTSSNSPEQNKHLNSLPPPVDSRSSSSSKPSPVSQCTNVSESEHVKESSPTGQVHDSLLTLDEIVTYLNQLLDEHKESLQVRTVKLLFFFNVNACNEVHQTSTLDTVRIDKLWSWFAWNVMKIWTRKKVDCHLDNNAYEFCIMCITVYKITPL